jgi:uncharacterized protein (UPF0264 family)
VRSADEARAALAGGADLIDVKEPTRGPLGQADPDVIRGVIAAVRGRAPASAALGEWSDWDGKLLPPGLEYVKWGMARQKAGDPRPASEIRSVCCGPAPVLVAYADHRRADSPEPEWLAVSAIRLQFRAFLIDTAIKDGSALLDWIEPARLAGIRSRLADAGVAVALAGSLDEPSIRALAPLFPDWFAVRGAACAGGRLGAVCPFRVRRLREVIGDGHRANAG